MSPVYNKTLAIFDKKRWLSLAKPKFQLSTLNFQFINIMFYDSYTEKWAVFDKKFNFQLSIFNFQLIKLLVYDT